MKKRGLEVKEEENVEKEAENEEKEVENEGKEGSEEKVLEGSSVSKQMHPSKFSLFTSVK